jgi:hypothetical protein
MWLYPDGSRILELSTKCAPPDGFRVAAEVKAFLSNRGVDLSGEQQTRTRTALDYFTQLRAAQSLGASQRATRRRGARGCGGAIVLRPIE